MPVLAHNMIGQIPSSNAHSGLPLTQPLVINTTFPGCQLTNSQVTMTTPIQVTWVNIAVIKILHDLHVDKCLLV